MLKKREIPAVLRTPAPTAEVLPLTQAPLPVAVPLIDKLNRIHADRELIREMILDGVKGSEIQRIYGIDNNTYSRLCKEHRWEKPLDRTIRMLREQNSNPGEDE